MLKRPRLRLSGFGRPAATWWSCSWTAYMTGAMVVPIEQRIDAPLLFLNLQLTEAMDHPARTTGTWLVYCGACPLPEVANVSRCGTAYRSVSGYLEDERAWHRIARWVRAAGIRGGLRVGRHARWATSYPGMLDVATDLPIVASRHADARVAMSWS